MKVNFLTLLTSLNIIKLINLVCNLMRMLVYLQNIILYKNINIQSR